jgi:hypothetical protein
VKHCLVVEVGEVEQGLIVNGSLLAGGGLVVEGDLTADGSIKLGGDLLAPGITIDVDDGEVLTSNLVYSVQGATGDVELEAGSGISISGLTISASAAELNVSGWNDLGSTVALMTSTDNVGIGTTSPAAKLHVVGGGIFSESVIQD